MEGTIRDIADAYLDDVAAESAAQVRQVHRIADLVDASGVLGPVQLPGSERLVASGADGTPQFGEFLIPELAAMLKIGEPSAWALIHDVMNLRYRHHSRGLRPQQPPKDQQTPAVGGDGPR